MNNPFPGIDPFIESQRFWEDFHTSFLTYLSDAINDRLPDRYEARVGERFTLASFLDQAEVRPDVPIPRNESFTFSSRGLGSISAVAEPVVIPLPVLIPEEITERWIEVRRREDRTVVAVIELLSPSNKTGDGLGDYVAKRRLLIAEPIHLIEIDFLLGGHRLPMARPLPPGDFYVFVSRADHRPDCSVYAWSIRQPLPTIPIPLDAPDPDLLVDLAALYATAYERGRYARSIRRERTTALPIAPEDAGWVADRIRGE
jgi:hypothetical protein